MRAIGPSTVALPFSLVNLFGAVIYPHNFGMMDIASYAATSQLAYPALLITFIGGPIVAASLALLVYLNHVKKGGTKLY